MNQRRSQPEPPAPLRGIMRLVLPREERDAILEDLGELYARKVTTSGVARAVWWYAWQTVSFPLTRARSSVFHGTRDSLAKTLTADLVQDARYALRGFRATPGFTAVAVLTLGIGIGATSAIFTVVNSVLFKPLAYEEPDRLVAVELMAPGISASPLPQTGHTYVVIDQGTSSFEAFGAWSPSSAAVTGAANPEQVPILWVTSGIFRALRSTPALGRGFDDTDGEQGGPRRVILDHGYWMSRFDGDPATVGRVLQVNGESHVIIGVTSAGFTVLGQDAALYLPMVLDERQVGPTVSFDYQTLGRLEQGSTIESANADLDRLIPQAAERFKGITPEQMVEVGLRSHVHPLHEVVVGEIGETLWILFGTVGLVLLIAIANVANLFLVRAEGRQREVAVRTALGASRTRMARQFLLESVVLSVTGGVFGLALATVGVRLLLMIAPVSLPRAAEIGVDGSVLAFTIGLSALAAVVFGLAPVPRRAAFNMVTVLKEGATSTPDRGRWRGRNVLAVAEVALALVLLIGAGLMVRSMVALQSVHPGFVQPNQILTFRITVPMSAAPSPEQTPNVHQRILEALGNVPGVSAVGAASGLPLERRSNRNAILARDADAESVSGFYKGVAGDYFEAMGIPLVAGRLLTWDDLREQRLVGMVSESVARRYWQSAEAAIGQYIRHDSRDPWRQVVGVVGNVHDRALDRIESAGAYWPVYLENFVGFPWMVRRSLSYAVRTDRLDPTTLLPEIRQAVWSVDPTLPLADVQTMQDRVEASTARTSFVLVLLGIAASIALLLGMLGTYGVLAHVVSRRTREIGVRMALGAREGQVRGMVLRHAAWVALIGIVIGLSAAAGLTRFMASVLFEVTASDPATYAISASAILTAALLAGWLPARRAARVDPMTTLRAE